MAESIRLGTGPAAILMLESDEIVTLGAIVAHELYDVAVPVVVLDDATYAKLSTGQLVNVTDAGEVAFL